MNTLSVSILILLMLVVLGAPRRWALLGMAAGVLYLTELTDFNLLGFNMFPMRFLELAGFIRVMARREFGLASLNEIDRLFLLFYSYLAIVFVLRSNQGVAYQVGLSVDATLCYFTFRGLIGEIDDFRWFLRSFVLLLVPYVALLFVEMHTAKNPFSSLGDIHINEFFREGRVRCVGSFREYSLLGSLGACFLPLYIGLGAIKSDRRYAAAGILLSLAIVGFSNSGSPLALTCLGFLGWGLWGFRHKMSMLRRLGVAWIIAMALVMKAPVWFLLDHFAFGGDAWHRSYLIDRAIHSLGEWWLWGMPVTKTADWFAYTLGGTQADITNQFVAFGLAAGLMAIVLFIWLLTRAFQILGKAMTSVRLDSEQSEPASGTEYFLWGLGVMLAGHIANLISITYFDQFYVIWFLQLAAIVNVSQFCLYQHQATVEEFADIWFSADRFTGAKPDG